MLKIMSSTMANRDRHIGMIAALACSVMIASTAIAATPSGQQAFPSAAAAGKALVAATRADDMAALSSILGGDAKKRSSLPEIRLPIITREILLLPNTMK